MIRLGASTQSTFVKNGNVALYGVVNNDADKAIAGMQANSTPGVFRVENDLIVAGASKSE